MSKYFPFCLYCIRNLLIFAKCFNETPLKYNEKISKQIQI